MDRRGGRRRCVPRDAGRNKISAKHRRGSEEGCGPARCGRRLLPSPPPITSLIAAVAASSRRGHDGGGGTGYVRTHESLSGVGLASARQMASRRRVGLPALI